MCIAHFDMASVSPFQVAAISSNITEQEKYY